MRLKSIALALAVAATASPSLAQGDTADLLVGNWRGTYFCAQGETALAMTIVPGPKGLTGIFVFSPTPSNPDVASGSHTFDVAIEADGTVRGLQDRWLRQPTDYIMVDFSGRLEGSDSFVGTINHDSCGALNVERASINLPRKDDPRSY